MELITVLVVFGVVLGFCIVVMVMLAFVAAALSAYQYLEDPYDDLHEEKDYLDDYKTKRQNR
jgi:uncharacterized membrane protein required for colicin V production